MSKDQDKFHCLSESDRETLSAMVDDEAESIEVRRILKLCAAEDGQKAQSVLASWSQYNRIQEAARGEASGFHHLDISQAVSQAISGEVPVATAQPVPDTTAPQNAVVTEQKSAGWGKSLRGIAIAASVAVVTVVGVNVLQQGGVNHLPVEGAGNAQVASVDPATALDQTATLNPATTLDKTAVDQATTPVQKAQPRATFTTGANSQLAAFGASAMSEPMPTNEQRFKQEAHSAYDLSQAKARRAQELRKMEGYLLKHSQNAAMSNSTHGMIPMARAVNYDSP